MSLHIYATIALFLFILNQFQCSPEVVPSPLGVVDIWKRISGLLTDPPAGHIYINLKVSLCVTTDWHSIWGIKKIRPSSTETSREVSCWCRFRNNDIQWAGKHFCPHERALTQPGNVQLYYQSSEMSTWLWQLFPLQATLIRLLNKPGVTCTMIFNGVFLEDIILYIWHGVSECCPAHNLAEIFKKWAHSPVRLLMSPADYIIN